MKLAVDRIEDDIVICQDLDTKIIYELDKELLDFEVNDSDIIIFEDGKYKKDDKLKEDRLNIIKNKFEMVKNINK